MKLKKFVIVPLIFSIALTGCKDKKVAEEEVETAAPAIEETESMIERESTAETEREEKNTIAVVGSVNLKGGAKEETENQVEESDDTLKESSKVEEVESETEEIEEEKVDLRGNNIEETDKGIDGKESKEAKENVSGIQYQNFIADISNLENYKYVGYDGDSSVFLNIDDNKETTSMLAIIYRDNSYIKDKFNGMEDLGDEQKKQIGADLVKELTGIDINITQTDFRERECKNGKYLGLPFGDSNTNNSGYLAFRIKKDKLECVIDTIDSTEPEDRKQMKDDVLVLLETIEFNGNECDSNYDIAFDNINIGIQKMKNGE